MDDLENIVRVAKALSDPTRVRILHVLAGRELCVCEMVELIDRGQPTVSRHLGILRDAGLVEDVRDGQWVNYRLRRPARSRFADAAVSAAVEAARGDPALRQDRDLAKSVDRHTIKGS
jgi:ArsR family transcriptional regulator, arsenate/arsenite/antimonite-responsive transcriptional repressor